MGFKRNITITLACVITECLISLIPMIFMIYLFFMMVKNYPIIYKLLQNYSLAIIFKKCIPFKFSIS